MVLWASPALAETFDPYGHDILSTIWVQRQVYEALIDYDQDGRLEPKLATSWKRIDPTTWELELRPGVAFHDGTPLTSADVIFSLERAGADTSSQKAVRSGIAGVEAVDADTLRFTAATSNPIPWDDSFYDATLPSQLGDASLDFAETHANRTGPFMLEEFEPGARTLPMRNPNWWGLAQHPHNIDRIVPNRRRSSRPAALPARSTLSRRRTSSSGLPRRRA